MIAQRNAVHSGLPMNTEETVWWLVNATVLPVETMAGGNVYTDAVGNTLHATSARGVSSSEKPHAGTRHV